MNAETLPYRPNVGIALFNAAGRVLIARRFKEVGPEIIRPGYALRFTGKDSEVDIHNPGGGPDPEFVDWRWKEMKHLPDHPVQAQGVSARRRRLASREIAFRQ